MTITGRGAERYVPTASARRRPPQRRHERPGFRPDRAALWAVVLGALLILAAASSSHAATSVRPVAGHAMRAAAPALRSVPPIKALRAL